MIQPKYNKQNNTIFLGFDSIEINLVPDFLQIVAPLSLAVLLSFWPFFSLISFLFL